jgi:hypothetical protein
MPIRLESDVVDDVDCRSGGDRLELTRAVPQTEEPLHISVTIIIHSARKVVH